MKPRLLTKNSQIISEEFVEDTCYRPKMTIYSIFVISGHQSTQVKVFQR